MSRPQARNWCFTLQADEKKGQHLSWPGAKALPLDWVDSGAGNIVYLCAQVERAPSTGKLHLQGFLSLKTKTYLSSLKNKYSSTAHWEIARGTPEENKAYCSKSETRVAGPWEFGSLPAGKGARHDLTAMYEAIKGGATNLDLLEATEGKAAKFEKAIKFQRFVLSEKASDRQERGVKVIVLYGPTGKGKTYAAVNYLAGGKDYYICEAPSHKDSKVWFDGYEDQKTLILDDFQGDFCAYRYLLRLLDKYKLKIEIKGSFAWACWDTLVITSNLHPSAWYSGVDLSPLARRLGSIRFVDTQGYYQEMTWDEHRVGDLEPFVPPASAAPAAAPAAAPSAAVASTTTGIRDEDVIDLTQDVPETPRPPPFKKQKRALKRTVAVADISALAKGKEKEKDNQNHEKDEDSDLTDPDQDMPATQPWPSE